MFHSLCDAGHYPGGLTLRLAFQEPREGPSHQGTGAKTPMKWTARPGSPLPQPPVLPGSAESAGPSYGSPGEHCTASLGGEPQFLQGWASGE